MTSSNRLKSVVSIEREKKEGVYNSSFKSELTSSVFPVCSASQTLHSYASLLGCPINLILVHPFGSFSELGFVSACLPQDVHIKNVALAISSGRYVFPNIFFIQSLIRENHLGGNHQLISLYIKRQLSLINFNEKSHLQRRQNTFFIEEQFKFLSTTEFYRREQFYSEENIDGAFFEFSRTGMADSFISKFQETAIPPISKDKGILAGFL